MLANILWMCLHTPQATHMYCVSLTLYALRWTSEITRARRARFIRPRVSASRDILILFTQCWYLALSRLARESTLNIHSHQREKRVAILSTLRSTKYREFSRRLIISNYIKQRSASFVVGESRSLLNFYKFYFILLFEIR